MAEEIVIRNDFEYARPWLERLGSYRIDIEVYRNRSMPGDVYSIIAGSDEPDTNLVKDLFIKYKDRLRWLKDDLSDYNDPLKYATIEEYFDYLKKTLEEDYIKPLRNAISALGVSPDYGEEKPPTEEEISKCLNRKPTICSRIKHCTITDARDCLSVFKKILQLIDTFKRSPLYKEDLAKIELRKGKKRGRKKKYTDEQVKQMQSMYDKTYYETNNSKGSWGKVAKFYKFPSPKAAEMYCRRNLKRQNK